MWTTKKGKKDGQPRQKKTNMGLYVNAIKPGSMQECCNCAAKKHIVSNAALVSVTSRLVSVPEATKSDSERKTDSAPQPQNAGGSDGASA